MVLAVVLVLELRKVEEGRTKREGRYDSIGGNWEEGTEFKWGKRGDPGSERGDSGLMWEREENRIREAGYAEVEVEMENRWFV